MGTQSGSQVENKGILGLAANRKGLQVIPKAHLKKLILPGPASLATREGWIL